MKKLTDWYFDNNGDKREKQVVKAFDNWYKENLNVTYGKDRNAELTFGLPYTSSSSFAAVWKAQGEAELKEDTQWKFWYLAIGEDNEIIVGFEREDTGNFDTKEIVIGKVTV